MKLTINGESQEHQAPVTVGSLIETLDLGEQRIAVEVNRSILPRSEFSTHELDEGDVIEIIQAIGGG